MDNVSCYNTSTQRSYRVLREIYQMCLTPPNVGQRPGKVNTSSVNSERYNSACTTCQAKEMLEGYITLPCGCRIPQHTTIQETGQEPSNCDADGRRTSPDLQLLSTEDMWVRHLLSLAFHLCSGQMWSKWMQMFILCSGVSRHEVEDGDVMITAIEEFSSDDEQEAAERELLGWTRVLSEVSIYRERLFRY